MLFVKKRDAQITYNFDMLSSTYQPVTWLSLARFACVFLILLRHIKLCAYLIIRVRRLCVTMVIKLHGALAIFTKFIIFVSKLIEHMFRFIAIYLFHKSNHAR